MPGTAGTSPEPLRALCPQLGHRDLTLSRPLSLWNVLQSLPWESQIQIPLGISAHWIMESLDHGMVWVGMILKSHPKDAFPYPRFPQTPSNLESNIPEPEYSSHPQFRPVLPDVLTPNPPQIPFPGDPCSQNLPGAPCVTEKSGT